jgi:hypothetical protein
VWSVAVEVTAEGLARFFEVVLPHMNEVQRLVVAGAASEMFGWGGKTAVASASGMSRNMVIQAESEIAAGVVPSERLRAVGGGDKPLIDKQPGLLAALDETRPPGHAREPDVAVAVDGEVFDASGRRACRSWL